MVLALTLDIDQHGLTAKSSRPCTQTQAQTPLHLTPGVLYATPVCHQKPNNNSLVNINNNRRSYYMSSDSDTSIRQSLNTKRICLGLGKHGYDARQSFSYESVDSDDDSRRSSSAGPTTGFQPQMSFMSTPLRHPLRAYNPVVDSGSEDYNERTYNKNVDSKQNNIPNQPCVRFNQSNLPLPFSLSAEDDNDLESASDNDITSRFATNPSSEPIRWDDPYNTSTPPAATSLFSKLTCFQNQYRQQGRFVCQRNLRRKSRSHQSVPEGDLRARSRCFEYLVDAIDEAWAQYCDITSSEENEFYDREDFSARNCLNQNYPHLPASPVSILEEDNELSQWCEGIEDTKCASMPISTSGKLQDLKERLLKAKYYLELYLTGLDSQSSRLFWQKWDLMKDGAIGLLDENCVDNDHTMEMKVEELEYGRLFNAD
ncbi:hypothetical protein NADFUDRAFT_63500 [Nadsonia fulvescens var. elongata DSM 6958]|uniref:Uncharacterized protein n=1 Tax=Nadsonia fulvescens var. elongata DSM 6958 TaxID=857566 RepID=A0A1E3PRR1_9ASCO|nr:hypothetical protein NADFUDRAFT_63500 [Nadsonia fulvescens var. elongata DSM 6958]